MEHDGFEVGTHGMLDCHACVWVVLLRKLLHVVWIGGPKACTLLTDLYLGAIVSQKC